MLSLKHYKWTSLIDYSHIQTESTEFMKEVIFLMEL